MTSSFPVTGKAAEAERTPATGEPSAARGLAHGALTMAPHSLAHRRIKAEGCLSVDLVPAEAFKLFTAAGERLWVPGWEPVILGPLPQEPGLVFLTGQGSEQTVWTVLVSDSVEGRASYSRVTPGLLAGIVTVAVYPSKQGSRIDVSYDLTALTLAGEQGLASFSPDQFRSMMKEWQGLIEIALKHSRAKLKSLVV